jgi:thioredoxin-like negative regulator of GroEL
LHRCNSIATRGGVCPTTTIVTDENSADVALASKKPVVVDFYGGIRCGVPNRSLVTFGKEYSDAAVFVRVNVQDAPELTQEYEVRQVPTLVVIHQGELLFQGADLSAIPPMKAVLQATKKGQLS